MADPSTPAPDDDPVDDAPLPPAAEQPDPDAGAKSALAKERAAAREATKALKAAQAELEQLKAQSMTDTEKAIAAARAEAAAETAKSYGARLATSAIKVAAKDRSINVDALLKRVDAAAFIGDDGEPDEDAITEWLDELAPVGQKPTPDLGQGARGTQPNTEPTPAEVAERIRRNPTFLARG